MNGTVGMESGLKLIRPSCGAIFVLRSPRSENASRDSNESTGFYIVLHIYIYIFFAFFFFFPWNNIILSKWPTKCVSRNSDNREKKRWYEWQMNNRESVNWNITDENNRHLVRKGYQETDAMITDRFLFSFRFTGQYY